jgi:FeS assembly SUF system protein
MEQRIQTWFGRKPPTSQRNDEKQDTTAQGIATHTPANAAPESIVSEPLPQVQVGQEQVVAALRQVYDPEIPVNIYDLGLIYRVDIKDGGQVEIDMTLTAPGCPVAGEFPGMVEQEVCRVPGVASAHVEIVWDPPWTQDRMSEAAKLELGMF